MSNLRAGIVVFHPISPVPNVVPKYIVDEEMFVEITIMA